MILWIDAQLSPRLAPWMAEQFGVEAYSLRWLGLQEVKDEVIFAAARLRGAVIMTKDVDFVDLVNTRGAPPQIIWITVGNTSTAYLKELLKELFPDAREVLEFGVPVVEISGPK
jgi:predicted nuclease of predicted toxin-antitoxin system